MVRPAQPHSTPSKSASTWFVFPASKYEPVVVVVVVPSVGVAVAVVEW